MSKKQTVEGGGSRVEAPPTPVNRMVKAGTVRVRAVVHLNEDAHRNPGDEFEVTAERAAALGGLVKPV